MKPATRRFLRNLVVRPARDNSTRWGFLFYFALVVLILVIGYVIMRPKGYPTTLPTAALAPSSPAAKVETRRATNAGANFTEVGPLNAQDNGPLAESERVETKPPEPAAAVEIPAERGFLDTVRIVTAEGKKPDAAAAPPASKQAGGDVLAAGVIDEHGAGISADGASSDDNGEEDEPGRKPRAGRPLQIQTGTLDLAALTVYKREDNEVRPVRRPSGFDTGNFLPKGQLIPVIFQTDVTTLDLGGMVEMQVAENVKFNGNVIRLPYGTKIYGAASIKNVADRIGISANTIVFTDGTELHLNGVALDSDARAGVRGYYVPPPTAVELFPYINGAAIGALQSLSQSQEVTTQSALGLTTSSTQGPNSWRNAVATSGQQALQDAFNREQTLLDQRYPAYVIVKRGTLAYIQLSSALDLDAWKLVPPPEEEKSAGPTPTGLPVQLPSTFQELVRKLQATAPSG
ncbi:MAG: TrbI/VirB10 family protein [Opitutaceae bacterium]|jgi:type IV secretory pathway VirB10-like protein